MRITPKELGSLPNTSPIAWLPATTTIAPEPSRLGSGKLATTGAPSTWTCVANGAGGVVFVGTPPTMTPSGHSHWRAGEKTPGFTVPLHSELPGGTKPGTHTPSGLPSL